MRPHLAHCRSSSAPSCLQYFSRRASLSLGGSVAHFASYVPPSSQFIGRPHLETETAWFRYHCPQWSFSPTHMRRFFVFTTLSFRPARSSNRTDYRIPKTIPLSRLHCVHVCPYHRLSGHHFPLRPQVRTLLSPTLCYADTVFPYQVWQEEHVVVYCGL
jgi:hypothetical protein